MHQLLATDHLHHWATASLRCDLPGEGDDRPDDTLLVKVATDVMSWGHHPSSLEELMTLVFDLFLHPRQFLICSLPDLPGEVDDSFSDGPSVTTCDT